MTKSITKSMLITGASGGIGAASALLASEQGWDVGVGYNSDAAGAEQVCKAVRANGQKAYGFRADLAEPDQIARMFGAFSEKLGPMSAFVNNAGIVMPKSRFEDISPQRLDTIFSINVRGAFVAAQHAVRAMAHHHGGTGGSIINISSVAAVKGGSKEYVDYAATKGAMDSMTLGLALELADQGVRVNAVRPGLIETGIHAKGGQPDRMQRVGPTIPMGRSGSALEVARTILFLASDASGYITGTFIEVSGGRHV